MELLRLQTMRHQIVIECIYYTYLISVLFLFYILPLTKSQLIIDQIFSKYPALFD